MSYSQARIILYVQHPAVQPVIKSRIESPLVSPEKLLIDRRPRAKAIRYITTLHASSAAILPQPAAQAGPPLAADFGEEIGNHNLGLVGKFVTLRHHRILPVGGGGSTTSQLSRWYRLDVSGFRTEPQGRCDTTEAYRRAANKFVVLPLSILQQSRICGSTLKEQRICG